MIGGWACKEPLKGHKTPYKSRLVDPALDIITKIKDT